MTKILFLLTSRGFISNLVTVACMCALASYNITCVITGATDQTCDHTQPQQRWNRLETCTGWHTAVQLNYYLSNCCRSKVNVTLAAPMAYWMIRWLRPTASSWLSWRQVNPVTSESVTGSSLCKLRPLSKFHTYTGSECPLINTQTLSLS